MAVLDTLRNKLVNYLRKYPVVFYLICATILYVVAFKVMVGTIVISDGNLRIVLSGFVNYYINK